MRSHLALSVLPLSLSDSTAGHPGSQNLLIHGKFLNLITDKWGQCNDICIFQKRLWVSQLVIKNDDVAYLKKNFSNKACSKLVQVSMVTVTVETAEFRSYRK